MKMSARDDADITLRRPKKLIVCCDGTWMDSDNGLEKESWYSGTPARLQVPSNVTRIGRAIKTEDRNHHPQIVYYQAGVGTGMSVTEHVIGGGTGKGISEHIREAYSFLANNYTDGDSIFLLGFSRGAFTARSVAGLIGGLGLLEKEAMPWFYDIFKDWENAGVPHYKPTIIARGKEPQSRGTVIDGFELNSPTEDYNKYIKDYKHTLLKRGMSRQVVIEAVGVWDTVGALGIPTIPLLKKLGLPDFLKEYKFFNTDIDDHIRHAFQALALDERRAPFSPTLWERTPGVDTKVKQVWFPGVHSNVGGSLADTGIADLSLAWMMSQLSQWIEFKPGYLKEQRRLNVEYNKNLVDPLERGWAMGKIFNSARFPTNLAGVADRTPGLYHGTNYLTGKKNPEPLMNTNETVHASVRLRIDLKGKGTEDKGIYSPAGLKDWELEDGNEYHDVVNGTATTPNGPSEVDPKGKVKWIYRGSDPAGYLDPDTKKQPRVMYEDQLGKFELELLDLDPIAKLKVLGVASLAKSHSMPFGNSVPLRSW